MIAPETKFDFMNVIEGPHLLGAFSLNDNGRYESGTSAARFLKGPVGIVNINLNQGQFAPDRPYTYSDYFTHLNYFIEHPKIVRDNAGDNIDDVGFVFSAGILNDFLNTDNRKKPYRIEATLLNGMIYLNKEKRNCSNGHQVPLHYRYGYRFEQAMLSSDMKRQSDRSQDIKLWNRLKCVYSAKIYRHTIIYWSEIDGIVPNGNQSDDVIKTGNYNEMMNEFQKRDLVELKVSIMNINDWPFRRFKIPDFWRQCFFNGVDRLLIGFRDENHVVREIKEYCISQLLCMAIGWNPNRSMLMCNAILNAIKKAFRECIADSLKYRGVKDIRTLPYCCIKFLFDPETGIVRLDEEKSQTFLPLWFITKIENKEE